MIVEEPPSSPARPRSWAPAAAAVPASPTRRGGVLLILAVLALPALYFGWQKLNSPRPAPAARRESTVVVNVPPPPPPPPLVIPPPPAPQEEKTIEQPPVEDEPPPEPQPDEPPPVDLGGALAGNGPGDAFGLGGPGGGAGGQGAGGNANRSRWGWYASQVQARLQQAVRDNRLTRGSSLQVEVKIWVDRTGRIARATLGGHDGDSATMALRDQVLAGLSLTESPPAGMPMPIHLRITTRRP